MHDSRRYLVGLLALALLTASAPASAQQQGYYVLDGFGGVHAGGGSGSTSRTTSLCAAPA